MIGEFSKASGEEDKLVLKSTGVFVGVYSLGILAFAVAQAVFEFDMKSADGIVALMVAGNVAGGWMVRHVKRKAEKEELLKLTIGSFVSVIVVQVLLTYLIALAASLAGNTTLVDLLGSLPVFIAAIAFGVFGLIYYFLISRSVKSGAKSAFEALPAEPGDSADLAAQGEVGQGAMPGANASGTVARSGGGSKIKKFVGIMAPLALLAVIAVLYLGPKAYRIYNRITVPTIDASSEEALKESIGNVASRLSSRDRDRFKSAFEQVVLRSVQLPPRADEVGMSAKERLYHRMDGKTFDEFMVEYYQTMTDYAAHLLALAEKQLAQLKDSGGNAEQIAVAEKDVADFTQSMQNFSLKLSRARAEL